MILFLRFLTVIVVMQVSTALQTPFQRIKRTLNFRFLSKKLFSSSLDNERYLEELRSFVENRGKRLSRDAKIDPVLSDALIDRDLFRQEIAESKKKFLADPTLASSYKFRDNKGNVYPIPIIAEPKW
jgi:hypothetical protein